MDQLEESHILTSSVTTRGECVPSRSAMRARLAREDMVWSNALVMLVRATIACADGNTRGAIAQLEAAVGAFDRAEMMLYAAVARRRLAVLIGGDLGRRLQRKSDTFMTAQEVKNPAAKHRSTKHRSTKHLSTLC